LGRQRKIEGAVGREVEGRCLELGGDREIEGAAALGCYEGVG